MLCLETNFLVDYLDPSNAGHDDALSFLRRRRNQPFFLPTFCLWEVARGPGKRGDADGIARTEQALDWGFRLPFTDEVAFEAARIEAELRREGRPLNSRDYPIAATVRNAGGTLVTRDERFADVPDLDVVRY